MRTIIFVDGAVGVGKSTFVKILAETFKSTLRIKNGEKISTLHRFNVDVLPEPLHRNWTRSIINKLGGYDDLLKFLLVRKTVAIEKWSFDIASDGLQELEDNVLIVERSIEGDRRVSEGYTNFMKELDVKYTGENVHYVFVQGQNQDFLDNPEQARLTVFYNNKCLIDHKNVHRVTRPLYISNYHIEAAEIVKKVLSI